MEYATEISSWLQTNRKQGIQLLQKLVQEPSKRYHEESAQAIVVEKCRQLGLEIDLWELGDDALRNHPYFYCDRKNFKGNPNLVAVKKGSGGGKSLILNAHIDVVPEGNVQDWEDDPFSGVEKDGKVYGRGTTDMKGGSVSLLLAIEAITALHIPLKGDVIFQSVIEEESGGAGTLAAILRGYHADGALIPEPTNLKFSPVQQGSLWFRVTINGKAAHGGTRYEGKSSINLAMKVIVAIERLEEQRNKQWKQHPLYKHTPIPLPINIGKMTSGTWPSSVPEVTVLEGRLGIAPTETMEEAQQSLATLIETMNQRDPWFRIKPIELVWFGARWLPSNLSITHPLVTTVTAQFKRVFGREPEVEASPWGTDGGYLTTVGDIPVLVFGPGETKLAHDANEYIEIDNMLAAAEVIALTILDWCQIAEEG